MAKRGKYSRAPRYRAAAGGIIALLLLLAAVGGVAAYLSYSTGPVSNSFTPDTAIQPQIQETFDGTTKSNVAVTVPDLDHAVYVRAAVIVTWQDKDGNVLGSAPVAGTDYAITYGTDWQKGTDGFWYYNGTLTQDSNTTGVLIQSCAPLEGKTPENYGLNVRILAQTVQAVGTSDDGTKTPVQDAWGVSIPLGG